VRVVLVPGVHSLEPADVDRNHGFGEQVEPTAQHYELATVCPDPRPIILAEIGYGLKIRHEAPSQPHQLDVTLGFPAPAAGSMGYGRRPRCCRIYPREASAVGPNSSMNAAITRTELFSLT